MYASLCILRGHTYKHVTGIIEILSMSAKLSLMLAGLFSDP